MASSGFSGRLLVASSPVVGRFAISPAFSLGSVSLGSISLGSVSVVLPAAVVRFPRLAIARFAFAVLRSAGLGGAAATAFVFIGPRRQAQRQ
ncbi:MAG TPA: hypothetical protein VGN42_22495 [Pirellulales bacterium]|nr:hypothetical protein [Pirellulales bacterium]